MSRGFVKEDDQEEVPIVPQRAFLPEGVSNSVTPAGMEQLLAEKQTLSGEKESLTGTSEHEKRISAKACDSVPLLKLTRRFLVL